MQQKFPNGSKVRLQSGGPNMTVVGFAKYGMGATTESYLCKWFDSKQELKEATFTEEALKLVDDKPQSFGGSVVRSAWG